MKRNSSVLFFFFFFVRVKKNTFHVETFSLVVSNHGMTIADSSKNNDFIFEGDVRAR